MSWLGDPKHIPEDTRMSREHSSVDTKLGRFGFKNDTTVVEPVVGRSRQLSEIGHCVRSIGSMIVFRDSQAFTRWLRIRRGFHDCCGGERERETLGRFTFSIRVNTTTRQQSDLFFYPALRMVSAIPKICSNRIANSISKVKHAHESNVDPNQVVTVCRT